MKNKLTVIISFLNEGIEVYNTIKSLRDTAGDKINILLINDCSTDGYDYRSVIETFEVSYVLHNQRKGVAASRDEGIKLCQTPYFLLLDAHMRVYHNDWYTIIVNQLEKDFHSLICCQTVPINTKGEIIGKSSFGAYIVSPRSSTGLILQSISTHLFRKGCGRISIVVVEVLLNFVVV